MGKKFPDEVAGNKIIAFGSTLGDIKTLGKENIATPVMMPEQ